MVDNISKIKDRLDIVDVISGYIKVQKAGVNYKARCPFHNEKTSSFYISPERQIWHCFGCSKGGDIFGFVKEIEGVEFPEALRILAQKAGIEIDQYDPAVKNEKSRLFSVTEAAARFFEKQLSGSNSGKQALGYLSSRGLKPETIKEFRLGYAPNDWYSLNKFLTGCGFSKKEIVDAGLSFQKEGRSDIYDRFRSRIMFPIFDLNGSAVGFTGRIFGDAANEEGVAKYINTPQTVIYDKSRVLYGLNKAKTEARLADRCVLVEGNMDVLMSYQAGVKNVIASSGTALTSSHLKLLQRYTTNLDFCFDTDQAGEMATKRGIGLALAQNFNIKVISIDDKECKDPADYVQKYGSKWLDVASKAKPVVEFYFDKERQKYNPNSSEDKKSIVSKLAPFIKRLASQVEKTHGISQPALFLRTTDEAVRSYIDLARDELDAYDKEVRPVTVPSEVSVKTAISDFDVLNEALLSIILKNSEIFKEELQNLNEKIHPLAKEVLLKIQADPKIDFDGLVKNFDKEKTMYLEFAYLRSQELWKDFDSDSLRAELKSLILKIKHRAITTQLTNIEYDIKEAESSNDKTKINTLVVRFNELTKELSKLNNA